MSFDRVILDMDDGEIFEMEEGEYVGGLYESRWADTIDREGTRWGRPHRDHMLYLTRMMPRMCLPVDHPLYEDTHDTAYELVCSSIAVFEPHVPPEEMGEPYCTMEGISGSRVRDLFPEFPDAVEIRPGAMYAVLCYTGIFHA